MAGAEKSLLTLLTHIDAEITLVLPKHTDLYNPLRQHCNIIVLPVIDFRLSRSPIRWFAYILNVIRISIILRRTISRNGIELILANSQKALSYGLMLKLSTKVRLIAIARDNLSRPLVQWMYQRMVDDIICVSDYISKQLPIYQNKTTIFPPIDTNLAPELGRVAKEKLNINPNCVVLGNVGQFVSWKNQIGFIDVAKRMIKRNGNIHFIMAGACLSPRDKQYRQRLIRLVASEGLQPFFTFAPFEADTKVLYSAMDILVHCAVGEPFGRVVAEAMAYTLPVVVFNHGGVREIVDDNINGFLIPPQNVDEMTEKCQLLASNQNIRNTFGNNGRRKILRSFSIERHVDAFHKVVQGNKPFISSDSSDLECIEYYSIDCS
jgi:glycosyltransferase involved in cell wall biosynthesis